MSIGKSAALSPPQCKAARALLGWTQRQLAKAAGVAPPTVATFESGVSQPMPQNLQAIRRALEEAGIDFIPGERRRSGGEAEETAQGGVILSLLLALVAGSRSRQGLAAPSLLCGSAEGPVCHP